MQENSNVHFLTKAKVQKAPNISGISEEQRAEILAFLQGAVYVWCQVKGSGEFAARNLIGEKNWNWKETPLMCLYTEHKNAGKSDEDAYAAAAINVGHYLAWLTDENNDKRKFTNRVHERAKHYTWDGKYEMKS